MPAVILLPGNWYWNTTVTMDVAQWLGGLGRTYSNHTVVNWLGSGDALRQTHSAGYSGLTTVGGGAARVRIDGASHAVGASSGLHAGDIESLYYDLFITNFSGAGDIGFHFDNTVHFTERMQATCRTFNCTSGVVFDVSGAVTSTSSFARCD